MSGDGVKVGAFIRVARARANRYLNPVWGAARNADSQNPIRGRFAGLKSTFKAWSLI